MSETTSERLARDRITFLRTLRAVRSFRSDPVAQEVLDAVLKVARWSGSASNKLPWERHLAGASLGIVLVMAGELVHAKSYA